MPRAPRLRPSDEARFGKAREDEAGMDMGLFLRSRETEDQRERSGMRWTMVRPHRFDVPLPTDTVPWSRGSLHGKSEVGRKTARRHEMPLTCTTTYHRSPYHPRHEPDRAPRLAPFSTRAGRGYRSSFAAARRDAKGYAPPCAAWSRTARHSLTNWRSPPRSTADRHSRRNRCPRTSQPPAWVPAESSSQAEGAPATRLSSRRSGRMPERDRPPSASCACTVETST